MKKFKKELHINQRQGANGWTFQVRVRTDNGDYVKSFSEKEYGSSRVAFESAIIYRNKLLYEISNNTVLKTQSLTVDDVFNEYMNISPDSFNTKEKHRNLYKNYVSTKDIPIQSLTKADIIADLNAITSNCSDDVIGRLYSLYHNNIVLHALNNEYINRDLMAGIKKPKSRKLVIKKTTKTDRETIIEVERLLLASKVNNYNKHLIYLLIELLYYTGMRPAEAQALTRDDIKKDYIVINKQLGSDRNNYNVITKCKTPKSARQIPIHPNLKPILEELLDYSRYDDLFRKDDGRYMNSEFVGTILRNVLKKTDISFNLYMLRHNMATALITNGTDTKTTMEILGHSQYNMSLDYANSSKELKDKAIKLLH